MRLTAVALDAILVGVLITQLRRLAAAVLKTGDDGIAHLRAVGPHALTISATVLILLSGCAPTFSNERAIGLSDQEVAIVENKKFFGCILCVSKISRAENGAVVYDRHANGPVKRFRLSPGIYVVRYETKPHEIALTSRTDSVELIAGRRYTVNMVACYTPQTIYRPGCRIRGRHYQATLWIEDDATTEVVAGEKW